MGLKLKDLDLDFTKVAIILTIRSYLERKQLNSERKQLNSASHDFQIHSDLGYHLRKLSQRRWTEVFIRNLPVNVKF